MLFRLVIFIKIKIEGLNLNYEVFGEGKEVILLHGWGASLLTFKNLSKCLSDNFKVYAVDLPGFGESEIGVPLAVEEIADIVNKFCNCLKIEKPILCGHSYGGRVAIIYAAKYNIEKLILIDSAGIKQKLKISKKIKIKAYKLLKKCRINVKMGSTDYKNADNVKRIMLVKAVNEDLRKYMKLINVPTLLIYGKNDKVTSIEVAKIINANIKNSSLIIMDGCGHFPYLDRPNYFNIIMTSFLLGENNDC